MYAYLALIFVGGAIGVYFGAKKVGYEPIQLFSRIFLVIHCHRFAVEIFYAATSCGKH